MLGKLRLDLSAPSISSAAASPVRIFRSRGRVAGSLALAPDCGASSRESFASFCRASSSWKTCPHSSEGVSIAFSATWPKSGLIACGVAYALAMPGHRTKGSGSLWWPTATATDRAQSGSAAYSTASGRHSGTTLTDAVRLFPTPTAQPYGSGGNGSPGDRRAVFKRSKVASLDTIASREGGALNPAWVECLMGFPPGWTEIPSAQLALF